ncbi:MAG: choice-of-anchor J domain-containing protein, partial [Lentimicrobiaceae bacterium]|nr:choice-of-anchor J domain-containing protein [Lentimicrobiaceae bacterium]
MKNLVTLSLLLSLCFSSFGTNPEIEEPYNLKVVVTGQNALFSWNNDFFIDNMESYNNFIIDNIGDYILYDGDGSATFGIEGGISFEHSEYTGSYIVFNPSQTTPPMTDPAIQPHSGSKFLACFAAMDGPNNDWLILPQQYVNTGTVFKFWAKSYNYSYGAERFKVGVSTTGTLPGDFTIISSGDYVSAPTEWTEYTYDNLNNYAGQKVHVAIACVSDEAYIFMVDDIFLGVPGKVASAPPKRSFSGFTVYLDDVEKASGLQNAEYAFTNLSPGTHTAGVKAVYTDGESEIISKHFLIGSGCLAPTNLVVTYTSDCDAELTWSVPDTKSIVLKSIQEEVVEEETFLQTDIVFSSNNSRREKIAHSNPPDRANGWLSWCGDNDSDMGTGDPIDFIVAARFTPADLAAASITTGDKINKMRFFLYDIEDITFTLQIYQGGTSPTNPGALMYQQLVTQPLIPEAYNIVELTTPYHIIASQELWIAYRLQITLEDQWPAGCDAGPRVVGKGDLTYYDGGWTNLWNLTEGYYSANWNIEALVGVETKYNIYRGNQLLATNFTGTSYLDTGFNPMEGYTWSVKAICPNSSESDPVSVTKEPCHVEYTIMASAGPNGSINPSGTITLPQGATQTFTFTPANSGYEISQVLVDGFNNPGAVANGVYTFTNITSNHTIHVNFSAVFIPVTDITNVPLVAT